MKKAMVTGGAGFIGSDARRPPARRGLAGRRRRRPVEREPREPRRRPLPARPPLLVPPHRRVVARGRRPDRAPPPRRDLPSRRAGRRARVGRPARVRRDRQHHRHAERVRGGRRGRRDQGRVRGVGRHALRHHRRDPDARGPRRRSRSRRTASPRRPRATTSTTTGRCAASSTPRSRWPTCTARARTRTARPVSSRSSPGKLLGHERPVIFGDGSQTRDFVYVDDVVDAFVRAVEKGGGLLMNIGTGIETSVQQLFDVMAKLTGFKQHARYDPPRAGEIAAQRARSQPGRASTSGGSRGRRWKRAWPAPSSTSRARSPARDSRSRYLSSAQLVERDRRPRRGRRSSGRGARRARARAGATRSGARARRARPRGRRSAPRPSTTRARASAAVSIRFSTAAPSDSSAMPHSARWRALVGVAVETVPREATEHERGRAGELRVRRRDQLVDARGGDAVGREVGAPARAHAVGERGLARVGVDHDEPPRARVVRRGREARGLDERVERARGRRARRGTRGSIGAPRRTPGPSRRLTGRGPPAAGG